MFCLKKIVSKFFWVQKVLVRNFVGSDKILVLTNFNLKKLWVWKNKGPNIFGLSAESLSKGGNISSRPLNFENVLGNLTAGPGGGVGHHAFGPPR